MSENAALINEIWGALKPYIPAKERLNAADQLVEIFDDYGMSEGFETEMDLEPEIKAASASLLGSAELDEEELDEY